MAEWADLRGIPFEVWRLRNIDQQIAESRRKQAMERIEEKPPAPPAEGKGERSVAPVPRQARVF